MAAVHECERVAAETATMGGVMAELSNLRDLVASNPEMGARAAAVARGGAVFRRFQAFHKTGTYYARDVGARSKTEIEQMLADARDWSVPEAAANTS